MIDPKDFDLNTAMGRTKFARRNAGIKSQSKIAEMMGMDRSAFARYETDRVITSENLPKFCEITKVSERWLLTGEGEMIAQESEYDQILTKYKQLSDQEQQMIQGAIDSALARKKDGK